MQDFKVNLENLMYGYYIKYDVLNTLVNEAFDTNSSKIDIYVDVYDMMKSMYKRETTIEKRLLVVSGIINLAAHMRRFFWTRYSVATRIYLVYGTNDTDNHKKFYQSFGENNDALKDTISYPEINSYINSQLDLLKILVAYIEGVYFVKRSTHCSMFMYDNLCENPDTPAIIITKDVLCYQLPAHFEDVVILRPMKSNAEDQSYYINHSNVLIKAFKSTRDKTLEYLQAIEPRLLSFILACVGLPQYSVKTMCNITITTRLLYEAIQDNKILNWYNADTDYIFNNIPGFAKYTDNVSLKYRFNAIDIVFQHRIYMSMAESKDISWLIDLHDPETVRNINNRYFIDNPLDLNGL